jgi:hypothetical protein
MMGLRICGLLRSIRCVQHGTWRKARAPRRQNPVHAVRGRRRLLSWLRPASFARGSRSPDAGLNGAAPVPYVRRSQRSRVKML